MTKQEIKEQAILLAMPKFLPAGYEGTNKIDSNTLWARIKAEELVTEIFTTLHKNDVVIKVKKELPLVEWEMTGKETPSQSEKIGNAFRKAYAGYGFFEPII